MPSRSIGDTSTDLDSTDLRVLSYLAEAGPDYPALVASNTGLHAPHVERRCERLIEDEYLIPVSGEVIYAITQRGEEALAGSLGEHASD